MVFQVNQTKQRSTQFLYWIGLFFLYTTASTFAQTPAKCFEIESILVDACVSGSNCVNSGSPSCNCEGKNEMVRFKIGPLPINTSDIDITWPSNSYLGISPANATTAGHVAVLNATIQSCGYLKEPTAGVLPAGKTILLVTSTDMCNTANSFANLTDTLYIIFQNAGNFGGHFGNYNSTPGLRTTIMKQISTGCSDTVTYDRSLLVNQSNGYGGSSSQNDGATAEFTWPGVASYVNYGCQAPFNGIVSNAGTGGATCLGGTVNLTGTAFGTYTGIVWKGGTGTFSNTDSLHTTYTANPAETDSVRLSMGVIGHCNDTIYSTTTIHIVSVPTASIVASGSTAICQGSSVTLTASGGGTYLWNTGSTNSAIVATTAGTDTVTVTNGCGSARATQTITVLPLPSVALNSGGITTLCTGTSLTLWATGIGNFSWSTGSTNDSISVTASGNYTVTASNSCGNTGVTLVVTAISPPTAVITPNGSTALCPGNSVTLNASGGSTYLWNTGATATSITTANAGIYSVTVTNGCGMDSTTVTITSLTFPTPFITPAGTTTICEGESIQLNASGGSTFAWSTGQTGNSITVSAQGNYAVVVSNTCGSGSDTAHIIVNNVTAQFISDTSIGAAPLSVNFTNTSSVSAISYLWTFGDGTTSTQYSPTHVFQQPGTYPVILSVTTSLGCIDTAMLTIVVIEKTSDLEIPNVFTPDGDGQNDLFAVKSNGIQKFNCSIFDRWGLKISEIKAVSGSWDGRTTAGLIANEGTYYYVIKATGVDGKVYDKTGFVQLIKK